ncbi:uncharacterized protein ACLA_008050 [Aspergillus clavatus NRRL 1]|uniref:Uncharacterized protein n=1 Tax=Aspergillus clavatus (strain ATCC 1007 / CBS 513.65 / DSM 816 / NCTC 3887 / NRRL 1 / QM 1276 / 107) TaxID=344612 RepID=A1CDW8_ASPCL|nr:uncharacterized protein ACLA_008050 [Aspergillus clavatus NRRL 1]EAW12045.1 hypothetical protein ACLA_008050 [Aspergillus clavatus NRRL 1]
MENAPCACLKYATRAWQRVDHMAEFSLESIIVATSQTIDFSLQAQGCPLHNFMPVPGAMEIRDVLLRIFTKLVSFLQIALTTYTCTAMTTMPADHPFTAALERSGPCSSHHLACGRGQEKRAGGGVACKPSRMTLGVYELSDGESRYLALDMICRSLRNIAHAVQQMDSGDNTDIRKADSPVLTLLFRVTELLESATAHLHDRKTSL